MRSEHPQTLASARPRPLHLHADSCRRSRPPPTPPLYGAQSHWASHKTSREIQPSALTREVAPTPNQPPLPSRLKEEGGVGRALEASAHEVGSLPGDRGPGSGIQAENLGCGPGWGRTAGQAEGDAQARGEAGCYPEQQDAEQGGPRTGPWAGGRRRDPASPALRRWHFAPSPGVSWGWGAGGFLCWPKLPLVLKSHPIFL